MRRVHLHQMYIWRIAVPGGAVSSKINNIPNLDDQLVDILLGIFLGQSSGLQSYLRRRSCSLFAWGKDTSEVHLSFPYNCNYHEPSNGQIIKLSWFCEIWALHTKYTTSCLTVGQKIFESSVWSVSYFWFFPKTTKTRVKPSTKSLRWWVFTPNIPKNNIRSAIT